MTDPHVPPPQGLPPQSSPSQRGDWWGIGRPRGPHFRYATGLPASLAAQRDGTAGRRGEGEIAAPRLRNVLLASALVAALVGGISALLVVRVTDEPAAPEAAAAPQVSGPSLPPRPEESLSDVAERTLPSVVSVQAPDGQGGSGFVFDREGRILTNAHVVESVGEGGTVTVVLGDGQRREARIVGTDQDDDLAVLQVADPQGLAPAQLGTSSGLRVGDQVLAIGSPLGLAGTVTAGIISATDRQARIGEGRTRPMIQTDASINPGNSGGPLVNDAGQVVGVNTEIATLVRGGGSIGIGFAIPIDRAAQIAGQIVADAPATSSD
jgi:putative serine protease PepD